MTDEISSESFAPGQIIFRQGDSDAHFYIIEDGHVGIFLTQNGKNVKIAEFGPGESFGEFALLDKAPRSASAQALTPVQAYMVTEKGFDEMLSQLPDWASCMLKSFVKRMKDLNKKIKDMPQFPTFPLE